MTRVRIAATGRPLRTRLRPPGDKSVAHRAAFFAGLATGRSRIAGYPEGADNAATLRLLAALGATVADSGGELEIVGFGTTPREPEEIVDCANSGTTTRLGLGLVAGLPFTTVFTGDASLRNRPMGRVTRPLLAMGARILGRDGARRLPIAVAGGGLRPYAGRSRVASAQVKSALLLAGLTGDVEVTLTEPAPSRDHTERFLRYLGYDLEVPAPGTVRLRPGAPRHEGFALAVPSDPSGGAFWAALAAASERGVVELEELCWNPGRTGFYEALAAMGATIAVAARSESGPEPVVDVEVRGPIERGAEIAGEQVVRAIDELPLLALLGLFVPQGVRIRDAVELRTKESDRIATTAAVARAFGGRVTEYPDGLEVRPGTFPPQARVASQGDHRIAMAAAVAAVAARIELELEGAEAVTVSYPAFWKQLERSGVATVHWG